MDKDMIRAFVARDRDRVAALKRDYHARRYRLSRGKSGLDAARVLWEHARKVRPDWPTARDRDEDFAHHVALKRLIDRAAHAFSAR
jgi:DNA-binding GntR family transcriptional regulator